MNKSFLRDFAFEVDNAARDFEQLGWRKVKVPYGSKEAKSKAWQNSDPAPDEFRKGPFNIGVQLGPKSRGLVDIDLDCPEAIALADAFFPELRDAAFGRLKLDGTHVLGHRLVICDDIADTNAKQHAFSFRTPEAQAAIKAVGLSKSVLLEVRAGGGYTGFPPSHYGDDVLTWRHRGATPLVPTIPTMPFAEVMRRAGLLAFASLVLAVYPREAGGRDDFCLQLAGALIHSGMEPDKAEKFINRLARLAEDDTDKRGEKAHRTKEKADAGEPTTNLSTFLAHVGLEPCEKEIRKWLGMPPKTGDKAKRHRPVIEVQESWIKLDGDCKVRRLVQMAELLLANDNQGGVYSRGRDLVRVTADNSLLLVTPHWLAHRLQELGGTFYRTDQYGTDYRTDCNAEAVLPLIDTADQRPFRRVTGLVFMPTLTRNEPGWDPETGLLLLFKDTCQVPLAPTREAAVASLDALLDLIAYFPFTRLDSEPEQHPLPGPAGRHDIRLKRANRSVALSGLLSCSIRGDLDDCPIHVSDAPAWGSGKTILLHMWHAIAEDGVFRTATWTGREEENAKNLFTLYGQGRPYIGFDDVEDRIRGKQLARAVTSPMLESRVLGHNDKSRTVSTRAFVAFSGTNVEVSEDLVRRTVVTRFDHGVEDPDGLKFPFHPLKRLQADRQTYREHCLTILRAYKAAGMPGYADLKCDGSFPSWRMVRGALVWLGQADPWDVVEVTRKTDANLYRKAQVFIAMWQGPGIDNPVSVTAFKRNYVAEGDVTLRLSPVRRLEQLLNDKTWNDTAVGMLLGKYRDQVFCGLKLSRQSDNRWVLRGSPDDGFETLMEIE